MFKKEKVEKGPQYIPSPLNNMMLNYCEYYMSASEKILFSVLAFVVGGAVSLVFYSGLFMEDGEATIATHISNIVIFALVGFIASRVAMPAFRKMLFNRRKKKLKKQFMDLMDCLATSLSAGNTVTDSFRNAKADLLNQYNDEDMIIIEVNEIIVGIDNGYSIEQMLLAFGERSGNEDILNFSNIMGNCFRMGGDFKNVVVKTRDIIASKIEVENEIATKISSNKMQLNVMTVMPILVVGLMKLMNPTFAGNLAKPSGVLVTTLAIGIFVLAYFWGQKIIDVK